MQKADIVYLAPPPHTIKEYFTPILLGLRGKGRKKFADMTHKTKQKRSKTLSALEIQF